MPSKAQATERPVDQEAESSAGSGRPWVRIARRIACWSAGLATLLLLFLGIRSTHTHDSIKVLLNTTGYGGLGDRVFADSTLGQIYCGHHYGHRGDKFLMVHCRPRSESFERLGVPMSHFWPTVHYSRVLDKTYYAAPIWLLATISASAWIALLPSRRFGLRSFLIGTAVLAAVVASARLEVRYPFTAVGDFISRLE